MLKLRLRITLKDRVLVALLSASFLLVALVVFGTARTHSDEHQICLLVRGRVTQLIDPRVGVSARDMRLHLADVRRYGNPVPSPDENYTIYFYQDIQRKYIWQVYLEKAGSSGLTLLQESVRAGQVYWSNDSRSFAYLWDTADGQSYLRIYSADGSNPRTIPLNEDRSRLILPYGWSPDGAYMAFAVRPAPQGNTGSSDVTLEFLSIADLRWITYSMPPLASRASRGWSPQGHDLYLILVDSRFVELTVVSPDTLKSTSLYFSATPSVYEVLWSPDRHYILLRIYTSALKPVEHILVIENSQDKLAKITDFVVPVDQTFYLPNIGWSEDGQILFLAQAVSTKRVDFLAFHVAENHIQTIATNIDPHVTTIVNTPQGTRIVILRLDEDGMWNFDVIDSDGVIHSKLYRTVARGTSNVMNVDTFVSPDSRLIALLFTDDGNTSPVMWAALDGDFASHQIIEPSEYYLSGVAWTKNSRWLIYTMDLIAPGASQESSEIVIVDTQMGSVRHLVGLPTDPGVFDYTTVPESQLVKLYTANSDGTMGLAGYTLDGSLLYRFNSLSKPYMDSPDYAVSPDHRVALLAFSSLGANPTGGYSLQFAWTDGRPPRVLEPDIDYVDQIVWSPDGTMVAVVYTDLTGDYIVRVLGTDAVDLWMTNQFNARDIDSAEWVACK